MDPNDPGQERKNFSTLDNVKSSFGKSNFSQSADLSFAISWISIAVAVIGTISIWMLDASIVQSKKQKLNQKDILIQKITSAEYSELDQKVSGLKAAYDEVRADASNSLSVGNFLTDLYSRVNKDIQIKNISVTSDGKLNIDGSADNYRSVADEMLALKSFNRLENIELLSTSMNVTSSGKVDVPFAFTAKIISEEANAVPLIENNIQIIEDSSLNTNADSLAGDSNTNGGENEAIE